MTHTIFTIVILVCGIYAHTVNSSISLGTCDLACTEEDKISTSIPGGTFVKDCEEAKKIVKTSGPMIIFPTAPTTDGIHVYCDQDTDEGGWIVIQRRVGGTVDFYRGYEEYKKGFGNKEGDFWLGLETIYSLTAKGSYELRVDLTDNSGKKAYAKYSSFRLGGAKERYALYATGYYGTAGDGLQYHNEMPFTTKENSSCAITHKGAWWYNACHRSNLNGIYGGSTEKAQGVSWYPWTSTHASLKRAEMKIRRNDEQ